MSNKREREPYNTQVNFITTKSQKEALEQHAENFGASVSEVLREVVRVWTTDPYAVIIKDFANQNYDDTVTINYNLFRSIIATVEAGNIKNVDQETIDEVSKFCQFLQEKIAVGVGKKVKDWKKANDYKFNPN